MESGSVVIATLDRTTDLLNRFRRKKLVPMGNPARTRITPSRKSYEDSDPAGLELDQRYPPGDFSDRFALGVVKILRFLADTFFAKRYGNRAIVLETIAAVPGMVGGTLQHLKALRRLCDDDGWIFTLLDEAENERMHLMTFMEIIHPSWLERLVVVVVQGIFYNAFFLLYLISDKTAHRLVGYFEEEAVVSYTQYLQRIDEGLEENVPAPQLAIDYWGLPADARLREVVVIIRADEVMHRDTNHDFARRIEAGEHY
jgi:ubiquinol oxidase